HDSAVPSTPNPVAGRRPQLERREVPPAAGHQRRGPARDPQRLRRGDRRRAQGARLDLGPGQDAGGSRAEGPARELAYFSVTEIPCRKAASFARLPAAEPVDVV